MKILAVNDDPIVLKLLGRLSTTFGAHELTSAPSGADALTLSDGTNAPAFGRFLSAIRDRAAMVATPMFTLTAMSAKRYILGAFATGATDVVGKPFGIGESA